MKGIKGPTGRLDQHRDPHAHTRHCMAAHVHRACCPPRLMATHHSHPNPHPPPHPHLDPVVVQAQAVGGGCSDCATAAAPGSATAATAAAGLGAARHAANCDGGGAGGGGGGGGDSHGVRRGRRRPHNLPPLAASYSIVLRQERWLRLTVSFFSPPPNPTPPQPTCVQLCIVLHAQMRAGIRPRP